ncbi:MAG TPA: 1-acyl-sn-glycerol-3-phosphate acyltransferase [Rubricoccaceae bacterium]|jgi:1-acyl-sn-glycerol-3-phosphate acyltransferase
MSGPLYRDNPSLGRRLGRAYAARTMTASLRAAFRRAVWAAPALVDPAPGRPLVVYANHHVYHDSFLLWHLLTRGLGRPMVVWMERWEQAPLFGPIGALPFPDGDARARAGTIRETVRRMTADPRTALYLYPEGHMHPPEDGLLPFEADLPRLARLLPPETAFVPVGIRTSWWGQSRPTAILGAGEAHDAPDGREAERLGAVLARLEAVRPADLVARNAITVFDGSAGPDERWDLSPVAPLFRRITF